MAPLPDGRLLLFLWDYSENLDRFAQGVAWLDPATGTFTAPDDPCPTLADLAYNHRLIAGDGWALLWQGWDLYGPESTFQPYRFE